MIVDPFSAMMAVIPVAAYLFTLGLVRVSGRSLVTTGGRDIAALVLAMSGLLAVGPAQLFFPRQAAMVFGPRVWIALAVLAGLVAVLIILVSRPNLVVYGRTPDEVFPSLLKSARSLDQDASGDEQTQTIRLPSLKVDLRCDGITGQDFTRVVSFVPLYRPEFWSKLIGELRQDLSAAKIERGRKGYGQVLLAAALLGVVIAYGINFPDLVVSEFRRWLMR